MCVKQTHWLVALAVLVAGCAPTHSTDPYAGISAYEQRQYPAGVQLSTTPPPVQGPIAFDEAIGIALANNPDLIAAGWDAVAARAELDFAKAERLPYLGVMGEYAHHLDEQRLLPIRQPGGPAVLSRDIISSDLVLTLPLFTGGRLVNQVKAAELLQKAANHDLARSREELVFNVSSMFFSILAQKRVVESLEFSRGVFREHLKRVDALIAAQKVADVGGTGRYRRQ